MNERDFMICGEGDIAKKPVVIKFRKLVKNWKNKINEEERSGKI